MRRSLSLSVAAAIALASSSLSPDVIAATAPSVPPAPPQRRRPVATQPESARAALRREIAEHNAAVAARRAEKLARRGAARKV